MLATLILTSSFCFAEADDTSRKVRVISDKIRFCESVYPHGDELLISNFGSDESNPRDDENRGYILSYRKGKMKILIPEGKLHKPTAMLVRGNQLFVCDADKLKIFDIKHPKKDPKIVTFAEDDKVINDIVSLGDDIYVTVTNTDRVYKLDAKNLTYRLWLDAPGPNGIATDGRSIYLVTIPHDYSRIHPEHIVYRVSNLKVPSLEPMIYVPGLYDGAAISSDGKSLYVSNWQDFSVTAIDLKTNEIRTIYREEGLSPADIAVADGVIYIPDLLNNRIIICREG